MFVFFKSGTTFIANNVEIIKSKDSGVALRGNQSHVTMINCSIHSNVGTGLICLSSHSKINLKNCEIFDNHGNGMTLRGTHLSLCMSGSIGRIEHNQKYSISVKGDHVKIKVNQKMMNTMRNEMEIDGTPVVVVVEE